MSNRRRVEKRRTGMIAIAAAAWIFVVYLSVPRLLPERRVLDRELPKRVDADPAVSRPVIHPRAFNVELYRPLPGRAPIPERGGVSPANLATVGTLTLLSITEVNGERIATLYDTSEDRLYMVRSGERVRGALVQEIEPRGVRAVLDAREQRWSLDGGAH